MTERGPGDDHLSEQFLVDGVAPSVIGDGPPESPFDMAPDPEPPSRQVNRPGYRHYPADQRQEPPTSPIPALGPPEEKRKSWLGRMFRG